MSELREYARWLAGQLSEGRKTAKALSAPQLGNSSIEAGKVEEYDADGTLVSVVGEQFDGTHAAVTLAGPVPPEPVAPTVTAGVNSAEVRWSGKFVDDALSPMDFSHVAVHASPLESFDPDSTTQRATITGESGDVATVSLDSGEWYFLLVAVSKAGKWSTPSDVTLGVVQDFAPDAVTDQIIDLDTRIDAVQTGAGGNTITNATVDADIATPGAKDGDRWQKWDTLDAGGKLLATWRWDGSQWIAEAMDPAYLPLIDIGQGTFGVIGGERLSADAVDGKTVTGATVQTAATGARVVLDETGLNGWDVDGKNYLKANAAGLAVVGTLDVIGNTFDDAGNPYEVRGTLTTVDVGTNYGTGAAPAYKFTTGLYGANGRARLYSTDGRDLNVEGGLLGSGLGSATANQEGVDLYFGDDGPAYGDATGKYRETQASFGRGGYSLRFSDGANGASSSITGDGNGNVDIQSSGVVRINGKNALTTEFLTPLQPADWSVTGEYYVDRAGVKGRASMTIRITRTGASFSMSSGAYTNVGTIGPTASRSANGVQTYAPGYLNGPGLAPLMSTIFYNPSTGQILIRPSSTVTVGADWFFTFAHTWSL